uniref:formyltransferase family protein n=1 Tax=Candidatus Electronema sp. TaxID=2698783 RepID=UPI0040560696
MQKIAVLLSGSGRTLDNFHQRMQAGTLRAEIQVVISTAADALGLEKARRYGYPALHAVGSAATNAILADYELDLIVLAGYLKLYQPPEQLKRRVLNIHPSLIPAFCGPGFYGHHVHEAVLARGCTVSGCTVHFADEAYDEGPIVMQSCVDIAGCGTADEIADRVFELECEVYPAAINVVDERGAEQFWRKR